MTTKTNCKYIYISIKFFNFLKAIRKLVLKSQTFWKRHTFMENIEKNRKF